MRIGIIAPPWVQVPPPAYGGTEAMLDVLARGLESAGHEVVLFATGDSTCAVAVRSVHPTATGVNGGGPLAELRQVIAAYDELSDCDVIHDHTLSGPLYAARFPHQPVVTTNHGPFDEGLTALYRAATARVPLVAISHHQASTATDVPVAAIIHHGVDVASFPAGDGRGGYALFVGRMTPDKGVDTAIRAAREAGVPLLIAAKMREEPEIAWFRDQIQPLLGGDVEFVGEVGGADKLELMASASCLLNPIRWPEPFGLVMIEALACGTPVIATPWGAAPEIVDDGRTGFLRTGHDALVEALQRVGELDRSTCRVTAKERFSAERMVQDHVALYRRVASSWPWAPGAGGD